MKHMKTAEVPATTSLVLDKTVCDLCGQEIKTEKFSADEACVRRTDGERYPEGGSGTETEFDLCVKCFDEKLIPWFQAQGVEPRIEEWEY